MKQEWKIGDCLELLPDIEDNSIDMILTDLPYGTTQCKWDVIIPFNPLWNQYKRIIKDNGAIVLTASQPFTSALVMSNTEMFRYSLVWEKSKATGFLNANRMPLKAHEDILVFSKKQTVYNPQKTKGIPYNKGVRKEQTANDIYGQFDRKHVKNKSGDRFPRSVQYFKTAESEGKTIHKVQKPISLAEYLIKTYTNEGDTVHDSCMGSGWSLNACRNLNRNYIGFEISDEWSHNYSLINAT